MTCHKPQVRAWRSSLAAERQGVLAGYLLHISLGATEWNECGYSASTRVVSDDTWVHLSHPTIHLLWWLLIIYCGTHHLDLKRRCDSSRWSVLGVCSVCSASSLQLSHQSSFLHHSAHIYPSFVLIAVAVIVYELLSYSFHGCIEQRGATKNK